MARPTKYKEHVRAAREWLGRAEDSLEQEDHIRGDLDVMLAQAELQRAQETEEGRVRRRWLGRLLPAGAAALVAALVWGLWPSVPAPLIERPSVMPAAEPGEAGSASVPAAAATPMAIESSTVRPMTAEIVPPTVPPMTAEISSVVEEPSSVEVPISEAADMEPLPQPSSRVPSRDILPSRDMQKLMSAAGQSLRAQ
ncbi:MAG: hypothetical protein ACFNWW_01960 [Negativicutes bacterium]